VTTRHNLLFSIAVVSAVAAAAGCASKSRIAAPSTTAAQGDEVALAARVKTVLLNDATVGKHRIDVHVAGADVRLAGRVATAAERDRAVALARAVPGVRTVTSDLEIRP
jgi:osmotically-inducible protein OsmY